MSSLTNSDCRIIAIAAGILAGMASAERQLTDRKFAREQARKLMAIVTKANRAKATP